MPPTTARFGYNTLGFGSFPNRFKPFHYYFIATDSGTEGLYGTEDFATIELVNASLPAAPQWNRSSKWKSRNDDIDMPLQAAEVITTQ